ncbi:SWIRM domain-containing protein [Radiomyces spectabilis]|uniref:SWIRM domain-containing protein n=1 Tax=Radiomyces spectabilis TaxID=64574 RepID=UPI00221EAF24|nr:SWIRM domain-containing protein [Radiomyces spectabilis]KAI8372702.1 SWIRM domain-containing protein [Radiomyces spectabilis]
MSVPQPAKIDYDFYEKPSTIACFDAIINELRHDLDAEGASVTFTTADLVYFTARIQQFQQDHLGFTATQLARKNGWPIQPRIPVRFFDVDHLSQQSPLYTVLKAAYSFRSDHNISDWQFDSLQEKDVYLDLISYIKQRLAEENVYRPPCIAFDKTVSDREKKDLTNMIKSLGGTIASHAGSASHFIYNGEAIASRDDRYYRILKDEKHRKLVHWIGLPASFDKWIDKDSKKVSKNGLQSVDADLEHAPWHVKSDWVKQSYKYNEWMDEIDYLDTEKQREGLSRKRRSSEPLQIDGDDTRDDTPVKKTRPLSLEEEEWHHHEIEARKYLSVQSHEIIIPSYAAWFEMEKVHSIEKQALPEFFNHRNRSKTPAVYKDYRDFMINTYRLNPLEYLTVTACRRNMTGDVCAIIRIHAFLEQWGLINYQIDSAARPSHVGPPFSGQFKIVTELPVAFQPPTTDSRHPSALSLTDSPALPSPEPAPAPTVPSPMDVDASSPVPSNLKSRLDFNLELRRNIFDKRTYQCSMCHTDCTGERFRHTKTPRLVLCTPCYNSGKLPSNQSSREDYVREEQSAKMEPQWTDQEVVLLLEGLEMYSEDWEAVAKHVGTRTRDECILHFLQLPVNGMSLELEAKDLGLTLPASGTKNPITSVVAFLASTVKPEVVAKIVDREGLIKKSDEAEKREDAEAEKKKQERATYELTYAWLKTKLRDFQDQVQRYNEREAVVLAERQHLEQERYQLKLHRLGLQKKVTEMQIEMTKLRQGTAPSLPSMLTGGLSRHSDPPQPSSYPPSHSTQQQQQPSSNPPLRQMSYDPTPL